MKNEKNIYSEIKMGKKSADIIVGALAVLLFAFIIIAVITSAV